MLCPVCDGSGIDPDDDTRCWRCDGTGKIQLNQASRR